MEVNTVVRGMFSVSSRKAVARCRPNSRDEVEAERLLVVKCQSLGDGRIRRHGEGSNFACSSGNARLKV